MRTSNRKSAKRLTAFVFLLCFVMAALLAEAFIFTHANHDHDHYGINDECVICVQIHSLENLLKQFGGVSVGVSLALLGLFVAIALLRCISALRFSSPVRLKIRLNN